MMKQITKRIIPFLVCCIMMVAGAAKVCAIPAPVTNLQQTGADDDSITLSWSYGNNAINASDVKYTVQVSVDPNFPVGDYTKTTTTWYNRSTVSGLNPASVYYVRVGTTGEDEYNAEPNYCGAITAATSFAYSLTNVKQIGATTTTVSISWDPLTGADCYNVYYGDTVLAQAATNAVEVPFPAGVTTRISLTVKPVKVSSTKQVEGSGASVSVAVLPSKVANNSFSYENYWPQLKQIGFKREVPLNADGVQIEVSKVGGGVVFTSNSPAEVMQLAGKFNQSFKYRARPYIKLDTVTTLYGAWSGYRYFSTLQSPGNTTGKKLTVKWKKVKNVKDYTVYIQKVGTTSWTKVAKTKKTKLTIKKIKKRKITPDSYNVKIICNIKVGKKTVKSDVEVQSNHLIL